MRAPAWLWFAMGCYSPAAMTGAPCSASGQCPEGQICSPETDTCVLALGDASMSTDTSPPSCAGAAPPANDHPDHATDVSTGGMFDADLTCATADDTSGAGCGGSDTRDVFFSISLGKSETVYFDTLDGDIPTELRIYPGITCGARPSGYTCTTGACGTNASQGAATLPVGTSCIVVAQRSANSAIGMSRLRVIHGGRTGDPVTPGTITDNTCMHGTTQSTSSCVSTSNTSQDMGYYALVCPTGAMIDASTCAPPAQSFDNNVSVIRAPRMELACYDDGALCTQSPNDGVVQNVVVPGPGLAWVVVDGFGTGANSCGPFSLTVTVH